MFEKTKKCSRSQALISFLALKNVKNILENVLGVFEAGAAILLAQADHASDEDNDAARESVERGEHEILVIVSANAVVNPGAMVIHLKHACLADTL